MVFWEEVAKQAPRFFSHFLANFFLERKAGTTHSFFIFIIAFRLDFDAKIGTESTGCQRINNIQKGKKKKHFLYKSSGRDSHTLIFFLSSVFL